LKLHTKKSFTLIELMIVIAIIAIIAAIAIPNLLSARKNGNEAAAIGGLKAIANAQTLFREGDKDGNNTLEYATALVNLTDTGSTGNEDLIDEVLANGTKQGYNFALTVPGAPQDQFIWTCLADATVQGTTGDRHFGGNMAGLIFFNATAAVTFAGDGSSTDPVLGN
jgi:type IV pilus assembly protein PilA